MIRGATMRRRMVQSGHQIVLHRHPDKVFLRMSGRVYLWRTIDEHGQVLGILVQHHRDAAAARFFGRLLSCTDQLLEIIIDGLPSYAASKERISQLEPVEYVYVRAGMWIGEGTRNRLNMTQPYREPTRSKLRCAKVKVELTLAKTTPNAPPGCPASWPRAGSRSTLPITGVSS